MRVLIYANVHPGCVAGGTQVYLGALVKALGELTDGNEEYVLLAAHGHDDWLRKLCGPNQRIETLHHTSPGLGRRIYNRLNRIGNRTLGRLSTFRRGGPDHYRRSSYADLAAVIPVSNGHIESLGASLIHFPYQKYIVTSLPSVFNPHDLQHLHLPQFFTPDTLMEREVSYPFACRLATRIAVASDWIADDLCEQYGIARRKVAVVPWGAATAAQAAPTADNVRRVRKHHDLPDEYLFYPAVAWPHKNHHRLIEAVALLNRKGQATPLVLSGARTGLTPSLERLVIDSGLSGQVRFLGQVPGEDMRAIYKGAKAVVVPTLFEAVSGPVAEAWQEGVPAACSDIPQLREQAGDAALLFDPYSVESIAVALRKLAQDGAARQQLIEAGTRRFADLDWRSTALKYRELYREAAQNAGTVSSGQPAWKL